HSKTLDIKKLARQKKQGIEETGREERYIFFRQLFKKYRAKYIITAHHADDNLETIILNFTRGATLQGLQGMQESEPPLLRPLLQFSKKQILDYLHHKKIPYKIDITNEEKKYFRNFIRHDIIPKLRKLNPNLPDTTAKNAENIREINNFLKQEAQNFLKNFLKGNRHHQLDAKKFRRQHLALQKQILLEAHKNLTGKTTDITSVNLDEILTMINKNIGNKHKKLGRLTISIKKNIMELKK
ncbi:tRNA lysidine(34) synthetase TilS, partial [Candidatus Peregrinibacteria bacterium]|nr:tRNA lysidine(34) synthetase TilS [Candidatus Peregrinibacteria bacterium]